MFKPYKKTSSKVKHMSKIPLIIISFILITYLTVCAVVMLNLPEGTTPESAKYYQNR